MRSTLFTLATLALVALTKAFPTGSGTCNSNQTVIEGVPGQPMGTLKELGYSFAVKMENNNYIPGGPPVKFCVHGSTPFKGLLLYAVDKTPQRNHLGTWNIPAGQPYKILDLNCTGDPKGTITHSDPSLKSNPCFEWNPPANDVGPLSFVGTVVQSKAAGFQIVRDPTVYTAKGGKGNPQTTTAMTTTAVTSSCTTVTSTMTTVMTMCSPECSTSGNDYGNPPKYETTSSGNDYGNPPKYETTSSGNDYGKPPKYETTSSGSDYGKPPKYETTSSGNDYGNSSKYESTTSSGNDYETSAQYQTETSSGKDYETSPQYQTATSSGNYEYEPTQSYGSANPLESGFNPPQLSAANGITYSKFILLLQLIAIGYLIV